MQWFLYRVDGGDNLTFVDESWLEFGDENGFPRAPSVIGTSLWNHITDLTSRHLYELFLKKVRTEGKPITVPFRCDGPTKRRFMELRMVRCGDQVEFQSRLVREEIRDPVPLLDFAVQRDERVLRMCVWCKKVQVADWVEAEEAVSKLKLFETVSLPMISHVTCPACEKSVLESIGE